MNTSTHVTIIDVVMYVLRMCAYICTVTASGTHKKYVVTAARCDDDDDARQNPLCVENWMIYSVFGTVDNSIGSLSTRSLLTGSIKTSLY